MYVNRRPQTRGPTPPSGIYILILVRWFWVEIPQHKNSNQKWCDEHCEPSSKSLFKTDVWEKILLHLVPCIFIKKFSISFLASYSAEMRIKSMVKNTELLIPHS